MKCHNFLCDNHNMEHPGNCDIRVILDRAVASTVKGCESRKRYNRIMTKELPMPQNEEIGIRLLTERNKYYGRK